MYTPTYTYVWLWDQRRASGMPCLPLLLSTLFFETVKVKFTVQAGWPASSWYPLVSPHNTEAPGLGCYAQLLQGSGI